MKHNATQAHKLIQSPLPVFPTPYPGESFYSILCRYHLRSGNARNTDSTKQLFGYNAALRSTLLSPYLLDSSRYWFTDSTGITTGSLLNKHTAFNLYALTSTNYEIRRIQDMIFGRIETTTYPRWVQNRIIHPSGYMRFCPKCADQQKKLYGEPYWQVLPQVNGVEYCPIHKTRIQNSSIAINTLQHKFYPASQVLKNPHLKDIESKKREQDYLAETEPDLFIQVTQGLKWLYEHGSAYAGHKKLCDTYHSIFEVLDCPSSLSYKKILIKHAIHRIVRNKYLYDYIAREVDSLLAYDFIYFSETPLYVHVILMIALKGSPHAFYEAS